jgi:hypothetical protein
MSLTIPQVFISSTSEFAEERRLLKHEIEALSGFRFSAYIYEADTPGTYSPEGRLERVLENSEIVLIILGETFGAEYPGHPISIVEWEYEQAKAKKKELKGYVKHPLSSSIDPRQEAFVSRAVAFRDGSWIRKFAETKQMVSVAIDDLKQWVIDAGMLWISGKPERKSWKDRLVLLSCAGVALTTISGIAMCAILRIPFETQRLLFACGLSLFGALFVLLKADVI